MRPWLETPLLASPRANRARASEACRRSHQVFWHCRHWRHDLDFNHAEARRKKIMESISTKTWRSWKKPRKLWQLQRFLCLEGGSNVPSRSKFPSRSCRRHSASSICRRRGVLACVCCGGCSITLQRKLRTECPRNQSVHRQSVRLDKTGGLRAPSTESAMAHGRGGRAFHWHSGAPTCNASLLRRTEAGYAVNRCTLGWLRKPRKNLVFLNMKII